MRRVLVRLLAGLLALALLGAVTVVFVWMNRHFGLLLALCAVGLLLSVLLPVGEAGRRSRLWHWLTAED